MPNRIIRDSARTSPTLDQLSDGAERFWWRLTLAADDHGRFDADPRVLISACFPLRVGRLTPARMTGLLKELRAAELVFLYVVAGREYGQLVTWTKHQRLRSDRSKFPDPPSGSGTASARPIKAPPAVAASPAEQRAYQASMDTIRSRKLRSGSDFQSAPDRAGAFEPSAASCGNPPQSAASCGNSRTSAAGIGIGIGIGDEGGIGGEGGVGGEGVAGDRREVPAPDPGRPPALSPESQGEGEGGTESGSPVDALRDTLARAKEPEARRRHRRPAGGFGQVAQPAVPAMTEAELDARKAELKKQLEEPAGEDDASEFGRPPESGT